MSFSYKPLLLSAFVFPGSGYFLLKKTTQGIVSAVITVAILAIIMNDAFHRSQIIADRIVKGEIPIDVYAIQQAVLTTPGNISTDTLGLLTWSILAVWLFCVIDCYRLSKKPH